MRRPSNDMSTRPRSTAGDPMTLGNMRANGVRSLDVSGWQCHHSREDWHCYRDSRGDGCEGNEARVKKCTSGLRTSAATPAFEMALQEGVPQDYANAVKYHIKAAEQGDFGAQFNLGLMYRDGQGVPQNYVTAHM
jgi:TPR repeat protein